MKTIQQIQSEIDKLTSRRDEIVSLTYSEELHVARKANRDLKSMSKRVTYLRVCKNYLLGNPSKEFIESEKERISNQISVINDRVREVDFEDMDDKEKKKKKSELQKEYNLKHLKEQYKTIWFILN